MLGGTSMDDVAMTGPRRLATGAAVTIALLCTAIGCVARTGGLSEAADFLNLFVPLWLGGGILASVLAAALGGGRSRYLASGCLITLLILGLLIGWRSQPPDTADRRGLPTLRLVQFNVWKDNADPAQAADWLRSQSADVLVLEETLQSPGIPALLRTRYPYQESCITGWICSTVILSRHRPLASGGLANGDPENRTALSAAWMLLPGTCGPILIVAAHLSRPWPWPGSTADRAKLLRFLQRVPRARIILAGDFNLTPWTFALQRFGRQSGLTRLTGGFATWPTPLGYGGVRLPALFPIDQVFAGADFRAISIERGPLLGSDHYPVKAGLADTRCGT